MFDKPTNFSRASFTEALAAEAEPFPRKAGEGKKISPQQCGENLLCVLAGFHNQLDCRAFFAVDCNACKSGRADGVYA